MVGLHIVQASGTLEGYKRYYYEASERIFVENLFNLFELNTFNTLYVQHVQFNTFTLKDYKLGLIVTVRPT